MSHTDSRGGRSSLVIFADSAAARSLALLEGALRVAAQRADLSSIAVCDARRRAPEPRALTAGRALATPLAMRMFDPSRPVVLRGAMVASIQGITRRAGVPLLVPPERDLNHPAFVDRLRDEVGAEIGLSLLVPQIFREPLIAVFDGIVNFHPGRLPAYRGLAPTAWEVYRGEALGGLSFHLVTRGIDEGPVVVADTVPLNDSLAIEELEWVKIDRATALFDRALDALVGRETGREQHGEAGYFGRAELRSIRNVEDPGALTWPELELRLRAFGALAMRLRGERYMVTRLRRVGVRGQRRSGYSFRTRDGVQAEACRFRYLPLSLARLTRRRYRARAPVSSL